MIGIGHRGTVIRGRTDAARAQDVQRHGPHDRVGRGQVRGDGRRIGQHFDQFAQGVGTLRTHRAVHVTERGNQVRLVAVRQVLDQHGDSGAADSRVVVLKVFGQIGERRLVQGHHGSDARRRRRRRFGRPQPRARRRRRLATDQVRLVHMLHGVVGR
ncbi:Uncharacterised protein [Mycobacteroides abscessus subsp. abscessus]|nr:Uncharacterised protein [Mycobacteroides abscessus subsp. abscessus]